MLLQAFCNILCRQTWRAQKIKNTRRQGAQLLSGSINTVLLNLSFCGISTCLSIASSGFGLPSPSYLTFYHQQESKQTRTILKRRFYLHAEFCGQLCLFAVFINKIEGNLSVDARSLKAITKEICAVNVKASTSTVRSRSGLPSLRHFARPLAMSEIVFFCRIVHVLLPVVLLGCARLSRMRKRSQRQSGALCPWAISVSCWPSEHHCSLFA